MKYLLNIVSVYGIKCLGGIYKQWGCFEIFPRISTLIQWIVWIWEVGNQFFQKFFFDFSLNFLNIRSDTIEKQAFIIPKIDKSKICAFVILSFS